MADRVTSSAIENLVLQLENDADLPPRVKDQVRSFQAELKKVSSFLNYLEANPNEQEVAELESKIRDLAYAAEDTIYAFMLNCSQKRRRRKVGKLFHCFGDKHRLRNATARMGSMKQRLREICDDKDRGKGIEGSSHQGLSMAVEEPDVIGFDGEAEALVKQLTNGELQQDVVSIVGIEGLGKTTLAKKIYSNESIRDHFNCCAWVHVPQEYRTADLLRCILKHVGMDQEAHDEANEEELKEVLSACLGGRRYLIIMDNVWRKEVWDEVKPAFPDGLNGSRILITSRSEEVAAHASPRPRQPHKPDFLSGEDSWELLRRKALTGKSCSQDLEKIGRQMAEKCDGLPLAIVLLGGILARKEKTVETWLMLAENTSKYLNQMIEFQGRQRGSRDIALSYHNLPQHLKICLLYFGVFPEDYDIPVRQLIQLWIAEGFIEEKGTQKMEEVGEEYLKELKDQCLIQVRAWRTDGGVKTCRTLRILRELCISAAEDRNLFLVHANGNRGGLPTEPQPLRLAVHDCSLMETLSSVSNNCQQLRSLQCYESGNLGRINSRRLWRSIYNGLGSLRVLNLGSVKVERIPKGVKKLLYLQYLRVNAANLTHIPRCICKLLKLQTLDLRESFVHIIPNEIWKMKSLRHLYFRWSVSLPAPRGSNYDKALWSLQTLSGVSPDGVLKRLMVKAKFPNVTKLSICSSNRQATLNFLESLDHLYHLQSLKIVNLSELPDPNAFPLTLTKITLKHTYLRPDCMQTLEKLPNLRILKLLQDSIVGPEITCNSCWFPQLQVLHLVKLEAETWTMGRGAMRSIQHLVIRECVRLVRLPDLLPCMSTTLQEVQIFQPSEELRETLQQLGNPNGCTIGIYDH